MSPRNWFGKIRAVFIFVGLGWVPLYLSYWTPGGRDFDFAMIGVMVMLSLFIVPILLCSILMPTYKGRLVAVPLVGIGSYLLLTDGGSSGVQLPGFFGMILWIFTFTAISLLIPEIPFMRRLYRRLFDTIPL